MRSRILHRDDDVVNYQVETKKRESLERQREELAQRVDNLTIYASTEGRVIGRDLNTLVGQYLASGATLMAIGDEHKKHVELSVAQKDVDFFVKKLGNQKFVANAPAAVLEKDRGKLNEAEEKLAILQQSREKILTLR